MLQSPGHSPRQIVPAGTLDSPAAALVAASGEAAPARKRAAVVLDEDTYVAAIERIIERDYFPSVPALRDRLDLLQAQRSGDPVLLRDVQLQILDRRRHRRGAAAAAGRGDGRSMSRTATPGGSSSFRFPSVATPTPFDDEKTPSLFPQPPPTSSSSRDDNPLFDDSLSLDQFMRRYTSEDNESFNRIMEKVNKKRRERYGHLLAGEQEEEEEATMTPEMETKRDRITDGYGTSGQPVSTLEGWKYRARNLLMYPGKDEAPLTEEEVAERAKGLTKEINKSNTRLTTRLSDSNSKPPHKEEDASLSILYTPVSGSTPGMVLPFAMREAERAKKYDLEDLRRTPPQQQQLLGGYVESGKRSENGFSFVRTPSPAPGVDESPFITWGEIEGTPLRLDEEGGEGFDGGSADGPRYSIPNLPSRDEKAHSLSRDAARKMRERRKMFRKPPLPSPARGGSVSPNIRTLSPAAQKFVRNAIAKSSSSVDESLRASYRGSSPGLRTPQGGGRSMTRFGRDGTAGSRSPSAMESSR